MQEGSGRGDQLLGRLSATAGDSVHQKQPHGLRRPGADICAEGVEHRRGAARVLVHRRLGDPSMGLIPVRKLADQCRDRRPRFADDRTRTEPVPDQIGLEALHAEGRVMAMAATIGGGTVTTSKMTTKRPDGLCVQIRQRFVSSLQEHAHVGRGSQVPDDGRVAVAVTSQRVREAVNIRTAESAAQPPQRLRGREVPVDHRVLLSQWAANGRPTVEQKSADGYGE